MRTLYLNKNERFQREKSLERIIRAYYDDNDDSYALIMTIMAQCGR
jgi:hypothetical protein